MVQRPALSKGELAVASALWEVGPASVRAVFDALAASQKMDFTTVQTYLRRLETKGYANSRLEGRNRIYTSRTKPGTVIRDTVQDLIKRLFGGEPLPLVRHLIEEQGIDEAGLSELRQLIDRMEAEKERPR